MKAFIGGLHPRRRIIRKIKHAGCTVKIEAAVLLSPRCLVTTKKADVVLGMILKQLFVLSLFALKKTTFHLESVIFKHGRRHITRGTSVMGNWGHLLLELVMQKSCSLWRARTKVVTDVDVVGEGAT